MNKDVVRKWIKALRSGEYTQTKYCHRNADNHYCVMGVICDLHSKVFNGKWLPTGPDYSYGETIPQVILDWLGKDVRYLQLDLLVYYNDSERQTFDELADYLEDKMKKAYPSFVV